MRGRLCVPGGMFVSDLYTMKIVTCLLSEGRRGGGCVCFFLHFVFACLTHFAALRGILSLVLLTFLVPIH